MSSVVMMKKNKPKILICAMCNPPKIFKNIDDLADHADKEHPYKK